MSTKHLAEAIILQSIEDLWDEQHREECIKFFTGNDFRTCAEIAGLDISDQIRMLNMLDRLIKDIPKTAKAEKRTFYRYSLPQTGSREGLIGTYSNK